MTVDSFPVIIGSNRCSFKNLRITDRPFRIIKSHSKIFSGYLSSFQSDIFDQVEDLLGQVLIQTYLGMFGKMSIIKPGVAILIGQITGIRMMTKIIINSRRNHKDIAHRSCFYCPTTAADRNEICIGEIKTFIIQHSCDIERRIDFAYTTYI